jgi:hypothetical protein
VHTALKEVAQPFELKQKPEALAISPDRTKLVYIVEKSWFSSKLLVICHEIIEHTASALSLGKQLNTKELHTIKRSSSLSICVLQTSDNYVAMVAGPDGLVEGVALD